MPRKSSVAEFLAHAIERSGKTQREIALQAGYERPNILSMMKQGSSKVPIEKVSLLAKACGVDPVHFLRIAMSEYHPSIWATITSTLGEPLTSDEKMVLEAFRETRAEEPLPHSIDSKTKLKEAFKAL